MCSIEHLHWLPEELNWSGFWDGPTDLTEEHHRTCWDIVGDPPSSQPPLSVTEMSPGIWRAALANGTWLWWLCRPRRELTQLGGKVKACCWHTVWIGQGKLFHPELRQPAFDKKWACCLEEHFECPTIKVGRNFFDNVRRKIKDCL
jgi:hypothetical protein